jgi:hypothetical protein
MKTSEIRVLLVAGAFGPSLRQGFRLRLPLAKRLNFNHPRTALQLELSFASKKLLQHLRAPACQHAASDVDLMVQRGMVQHPQYRMHGSGLRVLCAVNQAPNARVHGCPSAHCARLNCSKQLTASQAMVAERGARFS